MRLNKREWKLELKNSRKPSLSKAMIRWYRNATILNCLLIVVQVSHFDLPFATRIITGFNWLNNLKLQGSNKNCPAAFYCAYPTVFQR
jgi:hypothetical protein